MMMFVKSMLFTLSDYADRILRKFIAISVGEDLEIASAYLCMEMAFL